MLREDHSPMSTDGMCARVSDDVVLYIPWLTKKEVELLALIKRLYIDRFIRILINGGKKILYQGPTGETKMAALTLLSKSSNKEREKHANEYNTECGTPWHT